MSIKEVPFKQRIIETSIEHESLEKLIVSRIKSKRQKQSSYSNGKYTVVRFIDNQDREITACGRWIEHLQVGSIIIGRLQKRRHTDYHHNYESDWYLENPNKSSW